MRLPLRAALSVVSSMLLCAICVRAAVVAAEADSNTQIAEWFWPGHPDVLRAEIMMGVAQAALKGGLSAATWNQVRILSKRSPLDPEPFAVEGAGALREGRYAAAEKYLLAARKRDPRHEAARFLLVETYLFEQKVAPALEELVALTKIVPGSMPSIAALLANYAATPGAIPRLRLALQANPDVEDALLAKLAEDPRNENLILSLASPTQGQPVRWQQRLVSAFVKAGQFKQAFILWHQFSRAPAHEIGDFSDSGENSPFTWALFSSSDGAATADGGSRLDVQFFGRSDTVLASKIVILEPGRYQLNLRSEAGGSNDGSVHLLVDCLPGSGTLLNLQIARFSGGSAIPFQVPSSCAAEQIEFKGFAQLYPSDVGLSVENLQVRKAQ